MMSFGASQIKRLIHNNYWDMLIYPMKIIAHLHGTTICRFRYTGIVWLLWWFRCFCCCCNVWVASVAQSNKRTYTNSSADQNSSTHSWYNHYSVLSRGGGSCTKWSIRYKLKLILHNNNAGHNTTVTTVYFVVVVVVVVDTCYCRYCRFWHSSFTISTILKSCSHPSYNTKK